MKRTEVEFRCDAMRLLSALGDVADAPLEAVHRLTDVSQLVDEFACSEVNVFSATDTGQVVVSFKPSNRLMDLLSALRTFEIDSFVRE